MSSLNRANRKAGDAEIIRLNSVGLSLGTIAQVLGCHPTSVTVRLRSLNIPPADTRRTFMEDVFRQLTTPQQDWLADQLSANHSIKDFVRDRLIEAYNLAQKAKT